MKDIKIENMTSEKGNIVPNQFIIYDHRRGCIYFQSYNSIIVKQDRTKQTTYLDETKWDYSRTTGKYRNLFLGETKAETQRKIDSGIYKLANLNTD